MVAGLKPSALYTARMVNIKMSGITGGDHRQRVVTTKMSMSHALTTGEAGHFLKAETYVPALWVFIAFMAAP